MCCPNRACFSSLKKLITRFICLPNFRPYTQTNKKLCYQTRSSSKTFKLPTLSYLLLFFEVPQTFNPLSPFPPSTNTPHPSPSLSKKNHTRKYNKLLSPKCFQDPSFRSFSLSHGSWRNPSLQLMASSSFKNQWELKMICPLMDFKMKIFVSNETLKRFHPPIK